MTNTELKTLVISKVATVDSVTTTIDTFKLNGESYENKIKQHILDITGDKVEIKNEF